MTRNSRNIALLLLILGGGLLILFSYLGDRESAVLERIALTIFSPFQKGATAVKSTISDFWGSYIALTDLKRENQRLRKTIGRLQHQKEMLLNQERENQRLKKLLALKADPEYPSIVAQVIGEDAVGFYRMLFVNKGSSDGVYTGMPVTVAEGLVGRVSAAGSSASRVFLINDPKLSVDCRVRRTRDRGILTGSMDGGCILRYLDLRSDVREGDAVVTSGLDGSFPRGLSVGMIASVSKDSRNLFLEAAVEPAADLAKLEEVLVILRGSVGFDIGMSGGRTE